MVKKWKNLFEYYGFTEKEAKKYPIVSRILKKLTPERIKKENEKIQKIKLPPEIQKWVNEYKKVGERSDYIWKWLYKMNKFAPFIEIQRRWKNSLRELKTLFNMFIILVDDASEKEGKKLVEYLLKIPFSTEYSLKLNSKEKRYFRFSKKLWEIIQKEIKRYPYYKEFREIFYFDVAQFLNEVRYSFLIFRFPHFLNELECWMYIPQGMQLIIDLDLDLMCSKQKIEFEKMGVLRECGLILQQMGRIGNWLSTWEREVLEKDFTGGLVATALKEGIISFSLFRKSFSNLRERKEIIFKIKSAYLEKRFLQKWENLYLKIKREYTKRSKLISIPRVLKNFEFLLSMHLLSRGYK